MSKLVEGIKDRMVAAAREAAPTVVDAAQKAAAAAAEKVAEAVADAKNAAGETSVASEPATAAEPVAAAHAPEGAIFNPGNARGNLHLGIDVGSTTVKLAVLNDDNQIVYAKYQRHHTDVRACARDLFEGAATVLPTAQMTCAITGSGGLLLSQWLDLEFGRRSSPASVPSRPLSRPPMSPSSWAARTPRSSTSTTASSSA